MFFHCPSLKYPITFVHRSCADNRISTVDLAMILFTYQYTVPTPYKPDSFLKVV